jgi:hypothetical protein
MFCEVLNRYERTSVSAPKLNLLWIFLRDFRFTLAACVIGEFPNEKELSSSSPEDRAKSSALPSGERARWGRSFDLLVRLKRDPGDDLLISIVENEYRYWSRSPEPNTRPLQFDCWAASEV